MLKLSTALVVLFVNINTQAQLRIPGGERIVYPKVALTSMTSLMVQLNDSGYSAVGTGFIISHEKEYYLVTNFHITDTNWNPKLEWKADRMNRSLTIRFRKFQKSGAIDSTIDSTYFLFKDGQPQYYCIRDVRGNLFDLVAVPLRSVPSKAIIADIPSDLYYQTNELAIGDQAMAVGYPLLITSQIGLPIALTGFIATDPVTNPNFNDRISKTKIDLPIFYVQSPSGPGQSGSPVYVKKYEMDKKNHLSEKYYLIGVNSALFNPFQSLEFMIVWKAAAVQQLILATQKWIRSWNGGKTFKLNLKYNVNADILSNKKKELPRKRNPTIK